MASEDKIKELFEASKGLKKPGDYFELVLDGIKAQGVIPNSLTTITTTGTTPLNASNLKINKFILGGFTTDNTSEPYSEDFTFPLVFEEDNPFLPYIDDSPEPYDKTFYLSYLKDCEQKEFIEDIKFMFKHRVEEPVDKKKLLLEVIEELKLMAKEIQTDETEDEDILL